MKQILTLVLAVFFGLGAWGQQHDYAKFQTLLTQKDTAALRQFIPKWEQSAGQSGDTYAAWCNLLLMEARKEILQLSADTTAHEGLILMDSTGNKAGSITGLVCYDAEKMQKLYQKFDEGLAKYPDRLDLWFGKVHVQLLEGHTTEAVGTLKQAVERSVKNYQKWLWTNDKPTPSDSEDFFFSTLQDYFRQLYDAKEDIASMALVDEVLRCYPKNIYFLNDKGALLASQGKTEEALEVFLQLHELAPNDDIVTSNVAYLYKETGNKKQALTFYKKLLKSANEELRTVAKHELGIKD